MYGLLFRIVWQTVEQFSATSMQVRSGIFALLHSWGQNRSLHPHVHCIVPAAGNTLDGDWKSIGSTGRYLYPVHQLSDAFKGKFLASLKRGLGKQDQLPLFQDKIEQAYGTKWVVHCEPSLASADHVVKYLGQYTHRVAITNQRILKITDNQVTFLAKDYRDSAAQKAVTLDGTEFLRRFTMHNLSREGSDTGFCRNGL